MKKTVKPKSPVKPEEHIRMEFESYLLLTQLLNAEGAKLEMDFLCACNYIPHEQYKHGQPSGIEKAHRIFQEKCHKLTIAKRQLQAAAAATYADHPNKEMRKFWCVPGA